MNLFTFKNQFREYMHQVDAEYLNEDYFSGVEYRADGNYTDIVNKLRYYLELDDDTGELMTDDFKYEAIDFYSAPHMVEDSKESLKLKFYVVSEKLKNLLEQLKLPEHRYYSIMLDIDGKHPPKSYYLLQINVDENQFLDYKASTFYRRERIERGVYNVVDYQQGEIPSYKALKFIKEELELYPYLKTMVLNKELDWFHYDPQNIISEKAQQLFKANNIIGGEITPMYEHKSITSFGNEFGYRNKFGGVEIIMNGQSSMEGISESDFPKPEE